MIVTLTPNPSLDRTLHLDQLQHGGVNRVVSTITEPSGKGVNVCLALHRNGHDTAAVLPVAGQSGHELLAFLHAQGLRCEVVDVDSAHPVRTNISIVEADGTTTKINESGLRLNDGGVRRLVDATISSAPNGGWLAVCGSLPAGLRARDVGNVIGQARAKGARIALDASGEALRGVLSGDALPDLVKPNTHELAELAGRSLTALGSVVSAAHELMERGIATVLVSLGGDGGLLLDRDGTQLWGRARVSRVVNTAGAGDAFLAGYLLGADTRCSAPDRLAGALRFGTAAVHAAGTLVNQVDENLAVEIDDIDLSRPLSEPATLG